MWLQSVGHAGDLCLLKWTHQFTVGGEYLLLWGCEAVSHAADGGSKLCCSPHHHLNPQPTYPSNHDPAPSLLASASRQTSFLNNFIYNPHGWHISGLQGSTSLHISIPWANHTGYLLATAGSVNILFLSSAFQQPLFPRDNQRPLPCVSTLLTSGLIRQDQHPVLLIVMQHVFKKIFHSVRFIMFR